MTTIFGTRAADAFAGSVGATVIGTPDAEAWKDQLRAAMQGLNATTPSGDDGEDRATAVYGSLGSSSASAVTAQAIGQTEEAETPSAKDEFLEFMEMTPMERMRAQILRNLGVTEEQIAAMPPEERKKIEDKIRQIIEETVRRETEEKTAENIEADTTTSGATATETASTASAEDGRSKPDAVGPTLEQVLPFLRDDGGQAIGGKEAKSTVAANAEKDRENA